MPTAPPGCWPRPSASRPRTASSPWSVGHGRAALLSRRAGITGAGAWGWRTRFHHPARRVGHRHCRRRALRQQSGGPARGALPDVLAEPHHRIAGAGKTSHPSRGPVWGQSVAAALGGTSLAQVMNAVTVDRAATPEQFATFFAVVAATSACPSGWPPASGCGSGVDSGAATAWKLSIDRSGRLDVGRGPGAGLRLGHRRPHAGADDRRRGPTPEQVTASRPPCPGRLRPARRRRRPRHRQTRHVKLARPLKVNWPLAIGAGLPAALVLALLAGGLGLPAVRRRLRRRARHQTGDPVLMTAGAWLELIDALFRLGVQVDGSATSRDVATEVTSRFGEAFGPPRAYWPTWPTRPCTAPNGRSTKRALDWRGTPSVSSMARCGLRSANGPGAGASVGRAVTGPAGPGGAP